MRTRVDIVDGYRVVAREWGDPTRPCVVLVHGLVVSSRYMVPLARVLSRDFHVLAPDLPGNGRSNATDDVLQTEALADVLAKWISKGGWTDVVVVANSYGCQVVTEALLRHRLPVTRMVFVGPTTDPRAATPWAQVWHLLRGLPHEAPAYVATSLWDFVDCGVRRSWRTLRSMLRHEMAKRFPSLTVPVDIVRGEHDHVCPSEWALQLAAHTGRDVVVIPTAGHNAHARYPEVVADLVRLGR
jgi:2-hydroxy-6-oxonona-2,4-dienedioate hydrolase